MTALVRLRPVTPARRPGRIAILGAPNSGKTTLFNALTGHRAKAGNYPGVTVDRREGDLQRRFGADDVRLIDLPGVYSLQPQSEDETVAVRVLEGGFGEPAPDGVVVVVDATTIERGLPLLAEAAGLGLPVCVALTMIDELKARHGQIDPQELQQELGVPVVGVVGNRGLGIDDLGALVSAPWDWAPSSSLLRGVEARTPEDRFAWAHSVLGACRRQVPEPNRWTRHLDRFLLHPVIGSAVFLTFVAFFFQGIFTWATPAMDFLSGLMDGLADQALATLPDTAVTRLMADGVIRGVGAVIVFLPQIVLLFTVILFLEACGYMARAAFVVDRVMGWVGLEGRCFIALLSSYACAVPGIMATRTIPSPRDRLTTILVAPFATCSARLPVYLLLIAAFIPADPVLGPFTWQGLTLMGLYFLGTGAALLSAAVFKRGLLRGASLPFYLELPPYRLPRPGDIALGVWDRAKLFLRRAGTIILAVSVVLWFLLNLPRRPADPELSVAENQRLVLEGSYAASAGRLLEPVFAPMDFDWRINVGLVASQAAREVMVATLAQIYAQEGQDEEGLGVLLSGSGEDGSAPLLSRASALALLVYFAFAMQCMSTLAVIRRETGGWRWPVFTFAYMNGLAWLSAWLTFILASAAGA
ncbi:MAG: ferrous iron transporter B [Holophagales bacterium]|nr:ferrous iron transporter B [Holophagales bacterium]MYD22497.1 ferrous iron transporter B [Holophagales bacterium]MYI34039.1 ferrous iron transporter B [Holophagales bacterium]